jgi:hypothetical protein
VIAEPLNTKPKYVVSTTLAEPLGWQNSALAEGDVAAAVAALKREDGGDLHVDGSLKPLRLVDGQVNSAGAILATYEPDA